MHLKNIGFHGFDYKIWQNPFVKHFLNRMMILGHKWKIIILQPYIIHNSQWKQANSIMNYWVGYDSIGLELGTSFFFSILYTTIVANMPKQILS